MRDVHDARQRAALLAGDEVLTAQYREMVDGGVVTEEVGTGGGVQNGAWRRIDGCSVTWRMARGYDVEGSRSVGVCT